MLKGLGGYEFYTGMGIVTSVLVWLGYKSGHKYLMGACFLLCMASLYMGGYTIPMAFALLACVVIFFNNLFKQKARGRGYMMALTSLVSVLFILLLFVGSAFEFEASRVYMAKFRDVCKNNVMPIVYKIFPDAEPLSDLVWTPAESFPMKVPFVRISVIPRHRN